MLRVDPPIPTQSAVDFGALELNLSVSIVEVKRKVKELRDLVQDMKKQLTELKAEIRKLKSLEYVSMYYIIPLFMVTWFVKSYVVG